VAITRKLQIDGGYNYLKNTRRTSTFRAKAFPTNFPTKGLANIYMYSNGLQDFNICSPTLASSGYTRILQISNANYDVV
jgi:hypothetical protein